MKLNQNQEKNQSELMFVKLKLAMQGTSKDSLDLAPATVKKTPRDFHGLYILL